MRTINSLPHYQLKENDINVIFSQLIENYMCFYAYSTIVQLAQRPSAPSLTGPRDLKSYQASVDRSKKFIPKLSQLLFAARHNNASYQEHVQLLHEFVTDLKNAQIHVLSQSDEYLFTTRLVDRTNEKEKHVHAIYEGTHYENWGVQIFDAEFCYCYDKNNKSYPWGVNPELYWILHNNTKSSFLSVEDQAEFSAFLKPIVALDFDIPPAVADSKSDSPRVAAAAISGSPFHQKPHPFNTDEKSDHDEVEMQPKMTS